MPFRLKRSRTTEKLWKKSGCNRCGNSSWPPGMRGRAGEVTLENCHRFEKDRWAREWREPPLESPGPRAPLARRLEAKISLIRMKNFQALGPCLGHEPGDKANPAADSESEKSKTSSGSQLSG